MNANEPKLIRGIGLGGATALNMIDMIGVGPFITIPLIVAAMGGPQAMVGWIFGAVFAICDGLVWAELGAAMPGSGGSYRYLKEIYGPRKLGRMLSFLFIWQLSFSAPLSIASGCVGLSQYAGYIWPSLDKAFFARTFQVGIPALGALDLRILVAPATFVAISVVAFSVILLYRRITIISRMSQLLWVGVMGTIAFVITAGVTHFNKDLAFSFPPNAFTFDNNFFLGLGAAMLVANYDYWGYYNVCFLGEEVREPTRNIPRALLYSILAVAAIYIVMNISILGVMPWQELVHAANTDTRFYVVSQMMERTFGHWAALLVTVLVMWTAFASVFSLLLGYSRVPYAAAVDGNYFRAFARIHPEKRFPTVSLLALAGVAALFCFLRLADIIAALVVIRIMLQFLVQTIGLLVLRGIRPENSVGVRTWFYLLPAPLITIGLMYLAFASEHISRRFALFAFTALGVIVAAILLTPRLRKSALTSWIKVWSGTRPDFPRPFRMWLYPLPALLSTGGFLYVLFMRKNREKEIMYALIILLLGVAIYIIRAWHRKEWPFATVSTPEAVESSP